MHHFFDQTRNNNVSVEKELASPAVMIQYIQHRPLTATQLDESKEEKWETIEGYARLRRRPNGGKRTATLDSLQLFHPRFQYCVACENASDSTSRDGWSWNPIVMKCMFARQSFTSLSLYPQLLTGPHKFQMYRRLQV
jgi:hypothetical protein